jgi:FkbM family methyltransferase
MMRKIVRLLPNSIRMDLSRSLRLGFPEHFRVEHAAETFSQCGEDRILAFLFSQLAIPTPRYLDVGTWHPCVGNNTYLFYHAGAKGVCVEPNPDLVPLIREKRPRDEVLNVGVSADESGPCPYYLFEDCQFNTFDAEEAAARARSCRQPKLKEISVPVVSLESMITKYFPNGMELLSLDTEGLDLPLLESLNYKKHRPLAICVETVEFSETLAKPKSNVITSVPAPSGHEPARLHETLAKPKRNMISSLLAPHGYALYADTFVNTIYVDTERTGTVVL